MQPERVHRRLLAVLFAVLLATPALADTPTLANQVEIRRTAYGVPHIEGETLEAAAFGLGWCQAEDHCVTIMEHMLRARGELARHAGKDERESDFENRQYRVRARAIETYHKLSPDFRAMVEGYAAGFSYYVQQHRDELPDWVQPITPHDVAAHGLTGVARFAFDRGNIVEKLIESLESGEDVAALDDREGHLGSNMWAFAPERTKSGHAILMGNPHQPWSKVATYYEAHLTVPGKLNFYGSTFIGRPVLTTGFNEHLGWSHTVNYPDLEEIYELTLDPNKPDHYLFDGGAVPLTSEEVTIEYKTDDGGIESETRTFWHSPLGPIVHRTDTHAYALKSVAYDEFRFYEQWLRLAQSTTFAEFREVLDMRAIPMFNICYADREGNIYYLWNGSIPDIPHENKRAEAVPAFASTDIWTRVHEIGELPQLFNAKGGYVQNCNSPPYFTNLHEPLAREDFPDHFPDNKLSLRTQHSLELIHNDKKFSLEEVRDMKFSPRILLADRVKDDLIKLVQKKDLPEYAQNGLDTLKAWDNTLEAEARGAVLFNDWWELYSKDNEDPYATPWDEAHPMTTPHGIADRERAVETFLETAKQLAETHGVDAAWGEVHRVRRGGVDLPVSGGDGLKGAFRALKFEAADDGKRIVNSGDSWIFTVEFGGTPRAYTVVGYSQSGNPDSPHYNDQSILYANNEMKPAAFTEAEIKKQLLRKYRPGE